MRSYLMVLMGLGLLSACKTSPTSPSRPPCQAVKSTLTRDLRLLSKEFVGLATPDDAVNLAFKIGGQVVDIPVSKGRAVERGELIAELDPREVALEVEANRSQYEEARAQWERMKRLLSHEAIALQEYEAATTRYTEARTRYESSQALLADTRLRAPFSGVIESTSVDTYERVTAGQTIARLVNPVTRTVSFTLPEQSLKLLSLPSTTFSVEFDTYPNRVFKARLKNYARTSADASGFPTSLWVEDPDPGLYPIAPGMSCRIRMEVADTLRGAVAIPLSAIYAPASGGEFVWVIDTMGRVERRRVKLGEAIGSDQIAIDSGLEPNLEVVTAGVYRLREGECVNSINRRR